MTCIKKYNNIRITPMYALLSAYIFLCIIIIYFSSLKYLSNNSYFKWGPPIKVFQIEINDNMSFYILLFIYFVNEIINSLLSAVVYSWIINCIQDPKSKNTFYSKKNRFYKNVLPPLSILGLEDEKELINSLDKLNFSIKSLMVA